MRLLVACALVASCPPLGAQQTAPAPNPNKISVLPKGDTGAKTTAKWYITQQNTQLGRYSSSQLELKRVLHAMIEKVSAFACAACRPPPRRAALRRCARLNTARLNTSRARTRQMAP